MQKDIAAACGVSESMVSRWNHDRAFAEAVAVVIRGAHAPAIEAMHLAQIQVAATGSLAHYETQLRRLGQETPWAGPHAGNEGAAASVLNGGVTVNLFGMPPAPDRATLPVPIMRDRVTGAIVPIPPKAPLPPAGATPAATGV